MSAAGRVGRVTHPCLEPVSGHPVQFSYLTDQQKVAILLQAAGLLSLLERAGWAVPDWSAAKATAGGILSVPMAVPGRHVRPAEEILGDLLRRLFRLGDGSLLTGKGPARKSARKLLDRWYQSMAPVSADEAVTQILLEAPFLWEPAFGEARTALAGEMVSGEVSLLWVAGPGPFRLRLLLRRRSLDELRGRLASPEAQSDWNGQ